MHRWISEDIISILKKVHKQQNDQTGTTQGTFAEMFGKSSLFFITPGGTHS